MKEGHQFDVKDTHETKESTLKNAKPSIQKAQNVTQIDTFSSNKYSWQTSDNIDASGYYGATEMSLMMISKKGLYDFFGEQMKVPEATCKEINEFTWNYLW